MTLHPQANVPGDDVVAERKKRRHRTPQNHGYVVTVTQEHFVNVRVRNEEHAKRVALEEIQHRWGGGRNPKVTEVEEL